VAELGIGSQNLLGREDEILRATAKPVKISKSLNHKVPIEYLYTSPVLIPKIPYHYENSFLQVLFGFHPLTFVKI